MSRPAQIVMPALARSGVNAMLERELELRDEDLDRIVQMIHRSVGIVLNRNKKGMIYGRLGKRVRQLGFRRFRDYLDFLALDINAVERELFVNALTTNLTAFYREQHHFELLASHVRGRKDSVRVWTNAASTGEEAYSIAITLRQTLGVKADAQVLATDVDTAALDKAREGIYPLSQVLKHEDKGITHYFLRGQGHKLKWARVRPELAAMVEFSPLNLIAPVWKTPGAPFDAIFCRNVMIYFDKKTQARILSRFVPLLKPDGLLFAGHSESFSYISSEFQLRGRTVYTLSARE